MNINLRFDRAEYAANNLKKIVKNHKRYNTQEKFAELMNVDVRTVRRWFSRLDSLTTIHNCAKKLGISDEDILL